MPNFKFFSKCFGCKHRKFFVSKRKITIPVGGEITSKEYFCGEHYTKLIEHLYAQNIQN